MMGWVMMMGTVMTAQASRDAAPNPSGNRSAASLSRQHCGHQEDHPDSTNDRKLAEHVSLPEAHFLG